MPRSKGTSDSKNKPAPDEEGVRLFRVNGWLIGFHPEILGQLEKLISAVEDELRRHPGRTPSSQPARILAALRKLMFVDIPEEPERKEYRQGNTLGKRRKHWFRAEFGNGRYRLFFRYRLAGRILIFAWVNDQETLRTYRSSTDAYAVFARMLDEDNPPDDWDSLLKECTSPEIIARFQGILARIREIPSR